MNCTFVSAQNLFSDFELDVAAVILKTLKDSKVESDRRRIIDSFIQTCIQFRNFYTNPQVKDEPARKMSQQSSSDNIVCEQCAKAFKTYREKINHEDRKHNKEYKWPCDLCSKSYTTKSSRDLHATRKHPREEPYECDTCSRRFALKGDWDYHRTRAGHT